MLRTRARPRSVVAFSFVTGIGALSYWHFFSKPKFPTAMSFDLPVRVKDASGRLSNAIKAIPLLSFEAIEHKLTGGSTQKSITRHNGIEWSWHTSHLNSNDPIEDSMSQQVVERDQKDGDYMFFAVMDGHGGRWTSLLLEKVLIPAVALELSLLSKSPMSYAAKPRSAMEILASYFATKPKADLQNSTQHTEDPENISLAIRNAFVKVDYEILTAPLRLLESSERDLSAETMALPSILTSLSGSCAILALVNTATRKLYVACTGDCRAVGGYFDPSTSEWHVESLSEDQTGRNPRESARIKSEHPPNEANTVIKNGRILGGLEPSRAFGDARYKWPDNVQKRIASKFHDVLGKSVRPPPLEFRTPPYVTCEPVVKHFNLDPQEGFRGDGAAIKTTPVMRFIVLATDGLWDQLSSSEVVSLVSAHLQGTRGLVPKASLKRSVPFQGLNNEEKKATGATGAWIFKDENLATHLIRNAFGGPGADANFLRRLLSIPAPLARKYRDDTSVTVIWWGDNGSKE